MKLGACEACDQKVPRNILRGFLQNIRNMCNKRIVDSVGLFDFCR